MNKKNHFIFLSILSFLYITLFTTNIFAQDSIRLLHIFEAESSEKNKLLFNLEHLQQIINSFNVQEQTATLEFTDQDGNVLAVLGTIKNGAVNWDHKVINNTALLVKFNKDDYDRVLLKIKEKADRPGFNVQATEYKKEMSQDQEYGKKTKYIESKNLLGSCEITFQVYPDLVGLLTYPVKALPGEELTQSVTVTVENKGSSMARDVSVDLVISSDPLIPDQPVPASTVFTEDAFLEGGKENISVIKPGEKVVVTFKAGLRLPVDIMPGRFYLAVVLDRENKIPEANKVNNKDVRLLMITTPEPKSFALLLQDTQLIYQPSNYGLAVLSQNAVISDGREWRKCIIQPLIHQIKHANWALFHWELYATDRTVWDVRNATFCKKGGIANRVKAKVEVIGGNETNPPSRITVFLPDTRLKYELAEGKFNIETQGQSIVHIPFWKLLKVENHIYHLRYETWTDFFWEINTFKKTVHKITGGIWEEVGGTATPLTIPVEVN